MIAPERAALAEDLLLRSQVVREWYSQLAQAAATPGLAQHLILRMGELLPRFAAYYRRLRALPRAVRRALTRSRRFSLAGVALVLALGGGSARAGLINVNETTCTLANAIMAANNDVATGGCPAGSGDDVLLLENDILLGSPPPNIASTITIRPGGGSILDGAGNSCLRVSPSGVLSVEGITIQNCVAPGGGAIYNRGTVSIVDCTISGNSTSAGFFYGGGICNYFGTVTITDSTISGNTANEGGGISNDSGTITIDDSTISGNSAWSGGGIENYYDGRITLTNCVVSGNTAGSGGGALNGSYCEFCHGVPGVLDIRNSTISGNEASVGGGIALYQRAGLVLTQSTLSGNSATGKGGGIYADNPYEEMYLTVIGSTISGNSSGVAGGGIFAPLEVTLSHALIAGNDAPVGPEMDVAAAAADSFNLVGYDGNSRSVGFVAGPTDIVPAAGTMVADILAPLGDYGGPTQTHALVPGSPAVDAIPTSDCLFATDQRGFPRPAGSGCDIGSFELGAREPVGGSVTGLHARTVTCQNRDTGQGVRERLHGGVTWDCEAIGLSVAVGQTVRTSARAIVPASRLEPVGGAVTGMTPTAVFCQNLTSGQELTISTNAKSWDCEALGLVVDTGNTVLTGASGTVDPPIAKRGS